MPLFHLPPGTTIALNFLLWFLIHLTSGYLGARLSDRFFIHDTGLFKTRGWEQNGEVYQSLFRIKSWKRRLPDAGRFFGQDAAKRILASTESAYLERFVLETRRAEWTHWMQLFPVFVFFLFNEWPIGMFMVVYACCVNLPCMMAQRYNRPRIQRILHKKRSGTV